MRCYKCLEWGHIAKDCTAGPGNAMAYANPSFAPDGYGTGHAPQYQNVSTHYAPMMPMQQVQPPPHPPPTQTRAASAHLPRKWFSSDDRDTHRVPVNAHMQQSGPMQALQHHVRQERMESSNAYGDAPPPGSWNRQYRHPNE